MDGPLSVQHISGHGNALEESQVRSKHSSTGQNNVTGSVDAWNGHLLTEIPHQVSNTIEGVESEWESHSSLGKHFHGNWQSSKCRNNRGRVERNRQKRGGSVSTRQRVESTSHSNTGDSVETRQHPGELWLVDGQVWGHRTVLSLCNKDLIFLLVAHLDGGGVSHGEGSDSSQRSGSSKCWVVSKVHKMVDVHQEQCFR